MLEQIEKWIFPISVLLLIAVEITLIITLIQLRKTLKQLNCNMELYFGRLMDKIKGMVDLFIKMQLSKMGSGEVKFETENYNANFTFNSKEFSKEEK